MGKGKPKVKFGLKNVYYAMLETDEEGNVSFGRPKHIPGAVNMALSAQGDTNTFYADDVAYYVTVANNGYQGDLEMALIPDEFRRDVLGEKLHPIDMVLVEYSDAESKPFALLYQVANDQQPTRRVFYYCTAARPAENNGTVNNSKTPSTETLTLTAAPLADGTIKARTTEDTPDQVYNNWFNAVWRPNTESLISAFALDNVEEPAQKAVDGGPGDTVELSTPENLDGEAGIAMALNAQEPVDSGADDAAEPGTPDPEDTYAPSWQED